MSKSLFPSAVVPPGGSGIVNAPSPNIGLIAPNIAGANAAIGQQMAAASPPTPAPGPKAFELMVVSYDPDSEMLVARFKDGPTAAEYELVTDFTNPALKEGTVNITLGQGKLSPTVSLKITPRRSPPKFSSIEEAEAWMEENA